MLRLTLAIAALFSATSAFSQPVQYVSFELAASSPPAFLGDQLSVSTRQTVFAVIAPGPLGPGSVFHMGDLNRASVLQKDAKGVIRPGPPAGPAFELLVEASPAGVMLRDSSAASYLASSASTVSWTKDRGAASKFLIHIYKREQAVQLDQVNKASKERPKAPFQADTN